jgi:hypothetical protein
VVQAPPSLSTGSKRKRYKETVNEEDRHRNGAEDGMNIRHEGRGG